MTEHFATYFTHNPITHAQSIEQGLVPIDPKTGAPSAAYTKGRQLAEQHLAAKAEADAAAAKAAAAEAKTQAEKTLPGKTKWSTPSKKSKPLSDSETKQSLISVAGKTVSTDGTRPVLSLVTIRRKDGTEYTVATDGRRLTVITQPTYKPDTETSTEEVYDTKGVKYKRSSQPYPNRRQVIPLVSKHQASTTIDLSYYSFLAKGRVKDGYTKRIDSPFFNNGQHIFFNIGIRRAAINPVFMRDIYKQMQQLGKKLGFPPTIKAYYFDKKSPLLFTAEHNGITYQSVVMMPQRDHALDENGNKIREGGNYVYKTPDITPGDIILGEQPTIYSEQETPTGSFSLRAKRDLTFTSDTVLTEKSVKKDLTRLADKELHCVNAPDIVATVKARQRGKLVSPAARDKSVANGFTPQQHLALASRVDTLYKYAIPLGEYNDKENDPNIEAVFRFAAPAIIDGKVAFALLTLKRTDGDKLYSLELEEINQLGGTLDRLNHLLKEEPSTIPLRAAEDIVAELAAKVKEYFGENAMLSPSQQETPDSSPATFSLRRSTERRRTVGGAALFKKKARSAVEQSGQNYQ